MHVVFCGIVSVIINWGEILNCSKSENEVFRIEVRPLPKFSALEAAIIAAPDFWHAITVVCPKLPLWAILFFLNGSFASEFSSKNALGDKKDSKTCDGMPSGAWTIVPHTDFALSLKSTVLWTPIVIV